MKPAVDSELVFSLQQTGGRLPVNGKYFEYPFAETLSYACAAVFKLDFGQEVLTEFDKNKLVYLSPIKRERENPGRC